MKTPKIVSVVLCVSLISNSLVVYSSENTHRREKIALFELASVAFIGGVALTGAVLGGISYYISIQINGEPFEGTDFCASVTFGAASAAAIVFLKLVSPAIIAEALGIVEQTQIKTALSQAFREPIRKVLAPICEPLVGGLKEAKDFSVSKFKNAIETARPQFESEQGPFADIFNRIVDQLESPPQKSRIILVGASLFTAPNIGNIVNISGIVSYDTGEPVKGGVVTITNTDSTTETAVLNDQGEYQKNIRVPKSGEIIISATESNTTGSTSLLVQRNTALYKVTDIPMSYHFHDMVIKDTYLYGIMVDIEKKISIFQIYNIDNPKTVRLVGETTFPLDEKLNVEIGQTYGLRLSGNYAYVLGRRKIVVINVVSLTSPSVVSTYELSNFSWSSGGGNAFAVAGRYAYTFTRDIPVDHLIIIDINDPQNIREVSRIQLKDGSGFVCEISGNYLYELRNTSSSNMATILIVWNIRTPTSPVEEARLGIDRWFVWNYTHMRLGGTYAYIVRSNNGLIGQDVRFIVVDVSNPNSPAIAGSTEFFGNPGGDDLCFSGQHAYVGNWWSGVVTLDISNPRIPIVVDSTPVSASVHQVVCGHEHVFASASARGRPILSILSETPPKPPPPSMPASPINLRIMSSTTNRISLEWNDNSNNEDGFEIERRTEGGSYNQVGVVGVNIKFYTDRNFNEGTKYYYRVRAYNSSEKSDYTNEVHATIADEGTLNKPDLVFTTVTAPGTVKTNEEYAVNFTIENKGLAGTGRDFLVYAYLSTDNILNGNDVRIDITPKTISAMQSNNTYSSNIDVRIPNGLAGSAYIILKVDASNVIDEGSEGELNNIRGIEVTEEISITIDTNPSGLQIQVDGENYVSPRTFQWSEGSERTLSVNSPQGNDQPRYLFSNWNDGGAQSHTITVPSSPTTYTANFSTQYYLTVNSERGNPQGTGWYNSRTTAQWSVTSPTDEASGTRYITDPSSGSIRMDGPKAIDMTWRRQYLLSTSVNPSGGGSITLSPLGLGNWYDSGAQVTLTAIPATGYRFDRWSGDISGNELSKSLLMNGPKVVTALFVTEPNPPPAPPQNLVARREDRQITLTWNTNTEGDFLRYRIYGGTSAIPATLVDSLDGASNTTITIKSLVPLPDEFNLFDMGLDAFSSDDEIRARFREFFGRNPTSQEFNTLKGGGRLNKVGTAPISNDLTYYFSITAVDSALQESKPDTVIVPQIFPPANLRFTSVFTSQIDLRWDDTSNEDGYEIERADTSRFFIPLRTVSANTITYSDINLRERTRYSYRVRAYKTTGVKSAYSNVVDTITASSRPPSPSNVLARSDSNQVILSWNRFLDSNISHFVVYRNTSSGFTPVARDSVGRANYPDSSSTDSNLAVENTYYYKISAVNNFGVKSLPSSQVSATLMAAPTNIRFTYVSTTRIDISWTDGSTRENGFEVERKTPAENTYTQITTVRPSVYSDYTVRERTKYSYRVRAYNSSGKSAYSNIADTTSADDDTTKPVLSNFLPSTIAESSVFNIRCDIQDPSGIFDDNTGSSGQGVYLRWDNDGELINSAQEVQMSLASGNTYQTDANIPGQAAGVNFVYQVYAYDNDFDNNDLKDRNQNVGSLRTVRIYRGNSPPAAINPIISPQVSRTTDNLNANYIYSDAEDDPESGTEIRWYKNGGQPQPAYNDQRIIPSGATTKNQQWYFTVRPKDGKDFGEIKISPYIAIRNSPPTQPTVTITPHNPKNNDALICNKNGSIDADNDSIRYAYIWYKNGVLQQSIPTQTFDAALTLPGEKWKCGVTPNDGEERGVSGESQEVVIDSLNPPPAPSQNLIARREDRQIILTWSANTEGDFLRYRIYGGTAPNPITLIDSIDGILNTIIVIKSIVPLPDQFNIINMGLSFLDTRESIAERFTELFGRIPTSNELNTLFGGGRLNRLEIASISNDLTYYFSITAVDSALQESNRSNEVAVPLNRPPVVSSLIPGQSLLEEGQSFIRNLDEHPKVFADPDEDPLIYTATSSDIGRAITTISGSTLTVSPISEGTAIITVSANDSRGGNTPYIFNVNVRGDQIKVSPEALSFGPVLIGQLNTKMLTIQNTGNVPLVILSFSGLNSPFIRSDSSFTIAVRGSVDIPIRFAPTINQAYLDTLIVTSSDPINHSVSVVVSGIGQELPDLIVSGDPQGPANVVPGGNYAIVVPIQNQGISPATSDFDVTVYLSDDGIVEDEDDIRVGDLSPGSLLLSGSTMNASVPVMIPSNQRPGVYYWGAKVDAKGVEAESNDNNNSRLGNQVTVSEPDSVGPIIFDHFRVDDDNKTSRGNNNGIVEPGEKIELNIFLKNSGSFTASSVLARLSTQDRYTTIIDNLEIYGTIRENSIKEDREDFDFSVSENTPEGHKVSFILDVRAARGRAWIDSFEVNVEAASVTRVVSGQLTENSYRFSNGTYYNLHEVELASGQNLSLEMTSSSAISFEGLWDDNASGYVAPRGRSKAKSYSIRHDGLYYVVVSGDRANVKGSYSFTATATPGPLGIGAASKLVAEALPEKIPLTAQLLQNLPNPFNSSTTLSYTLPEERHVRLEIFDIHGQKIKTLVDDIMPRGFHITTWNGTNEQGLKVATGIYISRLQISDFVETKKMILIR